MAKRTSPKKRLKAVPKIKQPTVDWHKALSKHTKAVLIDELVALIKGDRRIARRLAERFQIGLPLDALVLETRQAIDDATTYDFHKMNSNFEYDYEAYQTVEANFKKLIKDGQLESALELALELMKSGSEQVEMSDEGDMTEDIEDCLRVVIKASKSSGLSVETQRTWAQKMQNTSRVDFICNEELEALVKVKS